MELRDKVVLVTAAPIGIGQDVAVAFAKRGAKLVINYRNNKDGIAETKAKIEEVGAEVLVVKGDVSKPKDVVNLFEKAVEIFGRLDILVNNAGYPHAKTLEESSKDDWLKAFDDNFFSTVLCSREAVKIMKKQKSGKIINTGSVLGVDYMGRPGVIAYSAAKAAVVNFTKTLAKEFAAEGITINVIALGRTMTPHYEKYSEKEVEEMRKQNPIGRFVEVDEISHTFIYIAENDAITGEVIVVDGGFALKEL